MPSNMPIRPIEQPGHWGRGKTFADVLTGEAVKLGGSQLYSIIVFIHLLFINVQVELCSNPPVINALPCHRLHPFTAFFQQRSANATASLNLTETYFLHLAIYI